MTDPAPLSAFVVAGTHSGAGKTTVSLGIMAALRRRGLVVQPYKVGPDFIDPLHHERVCGRASRNLDGWMLTRETNVARFATCASDADVAVVEGVMGLFDGSDATSERGSTAEMAKILGLPVVLVVDAGAMARSAAAVVHGFVSFDPDLHAAGVIFNNAGSPAHGEMLREAMTGGAAVFGAVPRSAGVAMPERHLGLHLPHETRDDFIDTLADLIEDAVDLDGLLEAARVNRYSPSPEHQRTVHEHQQRVRIGVARDEAFCFYYRDNLDLLEHYGATLVEFSPIHGGLPEDLHGIYIGGGYPELDAPQLAANEDMRGAVRAFASDGRPIYGECGGLMYLASALEVDGESYPMCGVLPFATRIPASLTIAYVDVKTGGGLFGPGLNARGQLFHHSEIVGEPSTDRCFTLTTTSGATSEEGFCAGNVLAGYAHLHFASEPRLAETFVERCRDFA